MAAKSGQILRLLTRKIRPVLPREASFSMASCRNISTSRHGGENSLKDSRIEEEKLENCGNLRASASKPESTFVNRNPRNPEYFGYNKPRGYSTQYKKRNFYKRLNLVISNRHIKAYVEDQDGRQLVSASTEEFEITRHLYKPNDVSAALNIGRVMAERCLQAGLNRVSMYTTDIRKKEKFKEFQRSLVAGGVQMTEPASVVPKQTFYTGISVKKTRKGIIGQKMNNSTKRKFT